MNAKFLLSLAAAAFLLPGLIQAQDPQPAPPPSQPGHSNLDALRQELRDLPPEERRARMRELRDQYRQAEGQPGQPGQPAQRPVAQPFRNPNPPMGGGAAGTVGRVLMILTPEQRASLRDASEEDHDQVRKLTEKLREARKEVAEASFAKEFNEDDLRAKLEAAAKIDTELTLIRARTLSRVEPPLSDEQIAKLKNPPLEQFQPERASGPRPGRPSGDRPAPPQRNGDGNRPPPDEL